MKTKQSSIQSLEDLFVMELQYLYDMESEIIKALPKVIKAATDASLKESLTIHLEETKDQAERIERAFALAGAKPKKKKSEAIRGLVKDGKDIIAEKPPAEMLDAGIVASCRDIEHLEIAEYSTAIAWAEALGHDSVVELLTESLEEERGADTKLEKGLGAILERAQEATLDEVSEEDEDE